MKTRLFTALVVLFTCIVLAAPAFAAPIFTIPIDPIIVVPMFPLDPCFGATVTADMGTITPYNYASGTGYFTAMYTYDLSVSATPVVHVISDYKRVDFDSTHYVASDDTFIDFIDGVTVFGQSVNRDATGLIGIQGVITGAINFNGTKNNDIKGRYITTNWGGPPNRFCVFFDQP